MRWSVLCDNHWRAVAAEEMALDTSRGLRASGIVGIVLLIGLVAKNSILLVDYANQLQREGLSAREAMRQAMHEALAGDPRVFLMGEDVGKYGGTYAVSKGFIEEFGPERIRDTPLSELGFVGAGIGAALGGMRPIVEVMTVNFSLLALDQIVNTAAVLRHMSGGQFSVPLVVRMKGTNEDLGKKMLAESGLPIISADTMAEAATKIVAAVK